RYKRMGDMKRAFIFAFFAAASCSGGTPRPEFERFDPAVTPGPADYPDVAAVILLDRGTLELTVDAVTHNPYGKMTRLHRYKILRDAQGQDPSRIIIPYDPGSVVRGLLVRKISPTGRIDEVDDKNFADGAHE